MKRLAKVGCAVFVLALLQACVTTEPIIRYKNVLVIPPDSLLRDCPVSEPPAKDAYNAADWPEKERLSINHSMDQMKNISLCNTDKSELRTWKTKQQALFEEKQKQGEK